MILIYATRAAYVKKEQNVPQGIFDLDLQISRKK